MPKAALPAETLRDDALVISAAGVFSFELLRCLPSNPPELRRSFSRAAASFMSRSSSGFSNGGSSGARIWRACARLTLSAAVSLPSACASRGGDAGEDGEGQGVVRTARKIEHDDVDPELLLASGAGEFGGDSRGW